MRTVLLFPRAEASAEPKAQALFFNPNCGSELISARRLLLLQLRADSALSDPPSH